MQRHRLSELVRVRQLRASLAKGEAARSLREHAKAQEAVDEIRRNIAELERQAHSWDMPEAASNDDALVDAGYMHNVMSCRDQAKIRAREATVALPRAELARQRAHAEAREAHQIWSRAARRAEVVSQHLKQTQKISRRQQLNREEEQLAEERSACARIADIAAEKYR